MAPIAVRLALIAIAMCTVVSALDQADIDTILSLHNNARGGVAPTATNMLRMEWDADLAVKAQAYADSCPTGHSKAPNVGENLSWGWPTMTASEAVMEWINEKTDFSYDTAACINNKVCNHYTQLIWADTNKVGCGKASCKNLFGNPDADAWVCQYTPAGNYVGEKPYLSGTTCSACPNSTTCSENLCSPSGAGTNAPVSTTAPSSSAPATSNSNDQNAAAAPATSGASPSGAANPSTMSATPSAAGTPSTTNGAAPSSAAGAPSTAKAASPNTAGGVPSTTNAASPSTAGGVPSTTSAASPSTAGGVPSTTNAASPSTAGGVLSTTNALAAARNVGLTKSPATVTNAPSRPSSPTAATGTSSNAVSSPSAQGSLSTPTLSFVDDSQGATAGHFQKPHSKTLAPGSGGIRSDTNTSSSSNTTGSVFDGTSNRTAVDFITILGFPKKSFF